MAVIEIMALAGAVAKVGGAISTAIKAGKDINALIPLAGKLGDLDAQIQVAETKGHKGYLGKLTSTDQEAMAITQAKMKHREVFAELRSAMMIYGRPGTWETFCSEQARIRARKAEALKQAGIKKKKIEMYVGITLAVLVLGGGAIGLIYGTAFLRGLL